MVIGRQWQTSYHGLSGNGLCGVIAMTKTQNKNPKDCVDSFPVQPVHKILGHVICIRTQKTIQTYFLFNLYTNNFRSCNLQNISEDMVIDYKWWWTSGNAQSCVDGAIVKMVKIYNSLWVFLDNYQCWCHVQEGPESFMSWKDWGPPVYAIASAHVL